MKNLAKIAGVIFVINRLLTHTTPATAFFSAVYFITEYSWQLMLCFAMASYGISKEDKKFFLYLLPFFACELVYTALYWLGFIEYHSTLEGYAFINIEIFLCFIYFVVSQFKEIKKSWKTITKYILLFITLDIVLLLWLKSV